ALIMASIIVNFLFGNWIKKKQSKTALYTGILLTLSPLLYYKYSFFILSNIEVAFEQNFNLKMLALPLAISFYTFQQIAYLVDVYQGKAKDYNFWHYSLFVLFFPQLIAGPIVHHKDIMSQFDNKKNLFIDYRNVASGIYIFVIGLS